MRYLSYEEIHQTLEKIAHGIQESDFEPTCMVAIGGGGFIPARILRTYLDLPIYTVGLSFYDSHQKRMGLPTKVQWIDEVEKKLTGQRVLLVDEVDDTRTTLAYCLNELYRHEPESIGVAVLHHKRKEKAAAFPEAMSHFFVGETMEDDWLCYPWDATDIIKHHALCQNEHD